MLENILCTCSHEYILESENQNQYYVGITDYGIDKLGDIVFIELPEQGSTFSKGEVFGTIESVKSATEIYMPISGDVIEVNEEIADNPVLLNDENYEKKWLIKIESSGNPVDFADLLDYSDYKEELES